MSHTRTSTSTNMLEISLDLTAAGPSEFLAPDRAIPNSPGDMFDAGSIAPWGEPPAAQATPPPKPSGSRAFSKHSFSSLNNLASRASHANLLSRARASGSDASSPAIYSNASMGSTSMVSSSGRSMRGSETSMASTLDVSSLHPFPSSSTAPGDLAPPRELRKSRSGRNMLSLFKRQKSRPPPVPGTEGSTAERLPSPELPPSPTGTTGPPPPGGRLGKLGRRKANTLGSDSRPPNLPAPPMPVFTLDTNLDSMEGIIAPAVIAQVGAGPGPGASANGHPPAAHAGPPGSDARSRYSSSSDRSAGGISSIMSSVASRLPSLFSDPFAASSSNNSARRRERDDARVSPRSLAHDLPRVSSPGASMDSHSQSLGWGGPPPGASASGPVASSSWTVPESWHTVPQEPEPDDAGSASEDDAGAQLTGTSGGAARKPGQRRKTIDNARKANGPGPWKPYRLRIYRANNTYHVVTIGLMVSVAELVPVLNHKLLVDAEREPHRLYLKERGRERMLAQSEKPADILRRRLEQAGYDVADGMENIGHEDLGFLLRFIYKSTALGPTDEDHSLESFEYVNLTGRGLKTVPVPLYVHADVIVVLDLSRNPMLEVPLDFIQACATLRELRLSNMAMKKVPQSIRQCGTLNRLDLTCNRLGDLDESGLEQLPGLQMLKLENNRLERLPWFFPRMRALRALNISNNKFTHIPAVVCEMTGLVDLDISFNSIAELPEEIGQLANLEQLIMVGNNIAAFPVECAGLKCLRVLDCRRNIISDLSMVATLPALETLRADHNLIHALQLLVGPAMTTLELPRNDVTQLILLSTPSPYPFALTTLDLSHAKLRSLAADTFAPFVVLETLKLDYNAFRSLPEHVGELARLTHLSVSNNQLDALPASIGKLRRLETLDVNSNSLRELPSTLWNCASLMHINATSNLLEVWNDPPPVAPEYTGDGGSSPASSSVRALVPGGADMLAGRKGSVTGLGRGLPPLTYSLERLYLGENKFTDDILRPLVLLRELRVLNLSFNDIQEMPPTFFKTLTKLEELYLSGNKLSAIPTEDLHRLIRLSVLFLNGNRLQTLPTELSKVQSLTVIDVGSNLLKYNINNWEYDWNWNFNTNLKYLNLSGNKRLEIRPEAPNRAGAKQATDKKILSDFSSLHHIRVLGLMDVTTTFLDEIPAESEDRRVRTSPSEFNGFMYGIADTLGRSDHLSMFDLVKPEFRNKKNETVFAMFGRAQPFASNNKLSKFLHDNFLQWFQKELSHVPTETADLIPHVFRRTFLRLNKATYDYLCQNALMSRKMSQASTSTSTTAMRELANIRGGASGVVVYVVDKTMYVANAGNALAVISRGGQPLGVSRKHDPFDREETARIRSAEGWVSQRGFVNDEIDLSRSFGFYHLSPMVNPRPDVTVHTLDETDEFVIIGNRGLWDYVSYQTAVDIARTARGEPMIAAQKLRDFAMAYGAEGSIMIMVVNLGGLFRTSTERARKTTAGALPDLEAFHALKSRPRRKDINDVEIARLDDEVPPPVGHLALVFTDIRNSTMLWETTAAMSMAIAVHNKLARRWLRNCGGYEVKTEGDAFMCSFPTALNALWWCLRVQVELLAADWPKEILNLEEGRELYDAEGKLIHRGLSVRMGIHVGTPACEPDPVTGRMDYFGPMVNRTARINGKAAGGQIFCSADVVREIDAKIFETEPETEYSWAQPPVAIAAIRQLGVSIINKGAFQLKGLEGAEVLSVLYPADLVGREALQDMPAGGSPPSAPPPATVSRTHVQISADEIRMLALLVLRLEALASSRVFRAAGARKASSVKSSTTGGAELEPGGTEDESLPIYLIGDPDALVPSINASATDDEVLLLVDSLTGRLENALAALTLRRVRAVGGGEALAAALERRGGLDVTTLNRLLAILEVP